MFLFAVFYMGYTFNKFYTKALYYLKKPPVIVSLIIIELVMYYFRNYSICVILIGLTGSSIIIVLTRSRFMYKIKVRRKIVFRICVEWRSLWKKKWLVQL